MDHFQGFTEKSTLHKPSKEPQKTTEELVPIVVAALAGAMDSRELATATGFPPAAVGNALRLASNYGLVSKVPPFDKRVMTWERTKGKAYTTALNAWETRRKKPPKSSQQPENPTNTLSSSRINEAFWSRWLRNDPSTRPKLDD
ncbi:hypothetical protein F6A13_11080 [Acidithiobacillus sp. 'AMD consortium']|uniref:Uncharacterized protein n=6 Tax=Acidithiobacillus ferrooxidans TaxID=920 RepID=B7J721_ACIF2|nr:MULTISPECIES: hypothetical protein [Acidithiobacillus]EGQ63844.1 hypothetical protein GGI1_21954 [Acidithiobacillus sp. GGI-221]MBN6749057.1 hypothetical protein [Acidithiobacillus sp. PG05]ACK78509.1 hypothetical protein AFE_2486 [Acidithiobacillus ferrooxidans ATCC 23270]MBN6743952.1 hypothetical protein [Acidithiobacillus sp. MC2.2]MBU2717925.1 hypothetical protein [Acidithiobacillus ferridurans]